MNLKLQKKAQDVSDKLVKLVEYPNEGMVLKYCRDSEDFCRFSTTILNSIFRIYCKYGRVGDLINLSKKTTDILEDVLYKYFDLAVLYLVNEDYENACSTVKKMCKESKNDVDLIFTAILHYISGEKLQKNTFLQFSKEIFKRVNTHTDAYITYYCKVLLKLGHYDTALTLIRSEESVEAFKGFDLVKRRLELEILEKLERYDELCDCAISLLSEVCDESLDEWNIIVKYHKDPMSIINQFTKPGKRGPHLAEINLLLKNNQPIVDKLKEYSKIFDNKQCVFGDIKKYITDENKASLLDISDKFTNIYVNDRITCDINNPSLSIAQIQFYMKEYISSNDKQFIYMAIDQAQKYPEDEENIFIMIRLCGILGYTVTQWDKWVKSNMRSLQYLSLANQFINDCIDRFDLITLHNYYSDFIRFYAVSFNFCECFKSIYRNNDFTNLESMINFIQQLRKSHVAQFFFAYETLMHILKNSNERRATEVQEYVTENCFIKFDNSVLPVYFDDEELRKMMYPDSTGIINDIINCLFVFEGYRVGEKSYIQKINFLSNRFGALKKFLEQKGKIDFEIPPDPIVITMIALNLREFKCKAPVGDLLIKKLEEFRENNKIIEAHSICDVEKQNNCVNDSLELVINLIKQNVK